MLFYSTRGRLLVLCLEHIPNSDSGSIAFFSRAGSSSQRTSPFCESGGYATEQLSGSSLCSSPDDNSCDGIRLEESEPWQLRLTYSNIWPGVVLAICPYLDRNFLASAGNAVSSNIPFLLHNKLPCMAPSTASNICSLFVSFMYVASPVIILKG